MAKEVVYKLLNAPPFPSSYEVFSRRTLNFTDIVNNNNKFYNIEGQIASNGQCRVYTVYGRLGAPNPAKEVRIATDQNHANNIIESLVKSKTQRKNDPYVEVKLIKADVGSEIGKAKIEKDQVKIESLEKLGVKIENETKSSLHTEVQYLVRTLFGSTAQFIESTLDTKKCPLGQLSLDQIAKGKDILNQVRDIIHNKLDKLNKLNELNKLTSNYYSNIPHVLPHRINADVIRLDSDDKIDKNFDVLDILQDSKNIEKSLTIKSNVDSQYATLNTNIQFIDKSEPIWNWIENMLHGTRAKNHGFLGKIKIHRAYRIARNNEFNLFENNAQRIAKECGKQTIPDVLKKFVVERIDVEKEYDELYKKANVLPLYHGTRRANIINITRNGLLIRPTCAVQIQGAMYGSGIYSGLSSKALSYADTSASYWVKGQYNTGFLFILDEALGKQLIANNSKHYTKKEVFNSGHHSVWAKAGSAVINDEFIIYNQSGPEQQHFIKYILEIETQAK